MHEMAITEDILKTVLETAKQHSVSRIVRIRLEVGELADWKAEWLQYYFNYLSRRTIAEGAVIVIDAIPSIFTCRNCGEEFSLRLKKIERASCPACNNSNVELSGGDGYYVKEMEAY